MCAWSQHAAVCTAVHTGLPEQQHKALGCTRLRKMEARRRSTWIVAELGSPLFQRHDAPSSAAGGTCQLRQRKDSLKRRDRSTQIA